MTYSLSFALWLLLTSSIAGFFGALLGVGGGIFIVPAMVLLLHLPLKIAVAASIVSVIATSNAGGSSYVDQRISNLRLAMFLEIFTTTGALLGAVLALFLHEWIISFVFAVMLGYMAYASFSTRNLDDERIKNDLFARARPDRLSALLNLQGRYHDVAAGKDVEYVVCGAAPGITIAGLAGVASGLRRCWRRRTQSVCHEPLHERAHEGSSRHQQVDDRRHGSREFNIIFYRRPDPLHGGSTGGDWDYAGCDRRNYADEPPPQRRIEVDLQRTDGLSRLRDAGQGVADRVRHSPAERGCLTWQPM
jgi:uncharacterized membrane protein YfcA